MRNPILFVFATLLGLSLMPACKATNPDYCANNSACKTPEAAICDTKTKSCRECENSDECMALDPTKPACVAGLCVACGINADCKAPGAAFCEATTNVCRGCNDGAECAAIDSAKPVCAGGICAGCDKDTDCKSADKPVCDATTKSCRGCAASAECTSGVCGPSGACVGCVANTDCKTAEAAVCDQATNTCRGCKANTECSGATPDCSSTGVCVECSISSDCKGPTKPICNTLTHTCRACQADQECTGDPGVCMAHVDGRCAAPAETIYLMDAGPGTCSDTVPETVVAGTAVLPVCSLKAALALVTAERPLVVVRGNIYAGNETVFSRTDKLMASVVGQRTAVLTKMGTVVSLTSGSFYFRGLTLDSAFGAGITATGGTLRLDDMTVTGCPLGGVLLDGAAFDIRNTRVKNNGDSAALSGYGIEVRKVPETGPKVLTYVTSTDNYPTNLTCSGVIMGTGVLAPGVIPGDCGIASCGAAPSPTCGAP